MQPGSAGTTMSDAANQALIGTNDVDERVSATAPASPRLTDNPLTAAAAGGR